MRQLAAQTLGIPAGDIAELSVFKRSFDARKQKLQVVYIVDVTLSDPSQRDALLAARYRGVRTVEIDGRRVIYATDNEMAAAITDMERRIALASSNGRRRRILTSASKGL